MYFKTVYICGGMTTSVSEIIFVRCKGRFYSTLPRCYSSEDLGFIAILDLDRLSNRVWPALIDIRYCEIHESTQTDHNYHS